MEPSKLGKTVPSYRMALESEIDSWKSFKKALASKEDRKCFDELMDFCRNNTMASGAACNPKIFEPMVMSIMIAQQRKTLELEHTLQEVLWRKICNREELKF